MVEIIDHDSAEEWFKTQPRDICVAMASRAALRSVDSIGLDDGALGNLALPVFRAMITSAAAAKCSTADEKVNKAARSAARSVAAYSNANSAVYSATAVSSAAASSAASSAAASSAADSSDFAASSASLSADAAALTAGFNFSEDAFYTAAFSAVSTDASRAEKLAADVAAESLLSLPLWFKDKEPKRLQRGRKKLFKFFDTDPATWGFWKNWYLKMFHEGEPDWDLCREVALIPEDIWEKSPEAVAREIERIEDQLSEEVDPQALADALPIAEEITFDEEAKAYAVPIHMEREDLLSRTLARVLDAVDDVLLAHNSGLHEGSYEIRVLRRAVERYANDPARIEMDFVGAHATLTQQMVSDYVPTCSETLALQASLEEGARAIRATHPEVAENRALLTGQSLREMSNDEKAKIAEAEPILESIAREDLAEELRADIPVLVADRTVPTDSAPTGLTANPEDRHAPLPEEVRFFSRIAKILIEFKKTPELIDRVSGSTAYKAAEIVAVLVTLVGVGINLL